MAVIEKIEPQKVRIQYTDEISTQKYIDEGGKLIAKHPFTYKKSRVGGIKRERISEYRVSKIWPNMIKELMESYMFVILYHCQKYPLLRGLKEKYTKTKKELDQIHAKFKTGDGEFSMYAEGHIRTEYYKNLLHKKFGDFYKMVIPALSVRYFEITKGMKTPQQHGIEKLGGTVADQNYKPNKSYDYSYGRKEPSAIFYSSMTPEELNGGSDCVIC